MTHTAFFKGLIGAGTLFVATAHANTGIIAPTQDNKAYVLMEYDTGTILAQKNADTPLAPASLTKMMTSYIVEQRLLSGELKEDTPIKISENAWCRGSSTASCMYAPVDSNVATIDILKGIIIQSGNDASIAVAEHLAGSESAFAVIMNDEAAKLGMKNTTFKNATGMPAEGHLSSASDLATLSRAIIKNSSQYYKIYSEKEFSYNNITQKNRNSLLFSDSSVDGLKTGHTAEAGYSLAASSDRNDMRLIAIVLGAKDEASRAKQTAELFSFGHGHFKNLVVAPKDQAITKVRVLHGTQSEVQAVTGESLKVLTDKISNKNVNTIIKLNDNITAPLEQGEQIGQIIAMVDGKAVATAPLVAQTAVEQTNFVVRLWQDLVNWIKAQF